MARKLIATLAALLLAGCATAPTPSTPPTTFEYACAQVEEMTDANCDGLEAPIVVIDYIVEIIRVEQGWYKLHGLYTGGKYIFIHPRADDIDKTIVHETVHYILKANKVYDRCYGEETARKVHHKYAGTDYNDDWRSDYRCGSPSVGISNQIFR